MTIKTRTSLYISTIFTALFAGVCLLVVSLFSQFRKDEFEERLHEKAITSIRLLVEVQEVDYHLLRLIDRNTINKLYNEKTLIFDSAYQLIYSSLDDTPVEWSVSDLKTLKKENSFFRRQGSNELYGFFYDSQQRDFFVLIAADDAIGKRKLQFLIYLLLGAGVFFISGVWLFTFYLIKKQLSPLDVLLRKIRNINDLSTDTGLEPAGDTGDEIDLLRAEFHFMMGRINGVYQKQKEFNLHASHELRTPLARMSVQLENGMAHAPQEVQTLLKSVLSDVDQLQELIASLLLLARMETMPAGREETARLDEVVWDSIGRISATFPDFKIAFNMHPSENLERLLEVRANAGLLEIAFSNLLRNAYRYSDDQRAGIDISVQNGKAVVAITNNGPTLSPAEQTRLFEPFMRGENAIRRSGGMGIGLRIVHRILSVYGFEIHYKAESNHNVFILSFS